MLLLKVLVLELGSIDRFTSGAVGYSSASDSAGLPAIVVPVSFGKISTLDHEALDDSVEGAALVVQRLPHLSLTFLAGTQRAEVLGGLGDDWHNPPCERVRVVDWVVISLTVIVLFQTHHLQYTQSATIREE
jgi:hypothetical protein